MTARAERDELTRIAQVGRTFEELVLDPADVVSPATAEAMAAAIRNVRERMSRSELESRKVERRSRIVRDFSLDHAIERYHALYRSLARPNTCSIEH